MTTPTDAGSAELVARLRSRYVMFSGKPMFSNKGPVLRAADIHEAAECILALETRLRELEEAIREYVVCLDAHKEAQFSSRWPDSCLALAAALDRVRATLTQAERESGEA